MHDLRVSLRTGYNFPLPLIGIEIKDFLGEHAFIPHLVGSRLGIRV